MSDWIVETVKRFRKQDRIRIVIKPHPFIKLMPWSSQTIEDLIQSSLGYWPAHVHMVPEPQCFPNALLLPFMDQCIVYNSSSALEWAYQGKKVVVVAETYFSRKGFTQDPRSAAEYFDYLADGFRSEMTDREQERLRRYLFFLYFRINLETRISCLDERITFRAPLWLHSAFDLAPGPETNLDIICNGILKDHEFINTSRI
jgi:hypothetical protein